MNRATSVLVGILLLGFAAGALGAQPPSDYQHLKPLEWLIGDWVAEFTAPFDLGPIKKGDCGTAIVSRRWAVDRNCMLLDAHHEVRGKRVAISHEVAAWDPVAKRIGNWAFGALGTGGGAFTEVGDKAVLSWAVDGKDGKLQGASILEKIDADTYTWRAEQITLGDRKLPDWPKVTYRRKTGAPAGELWTAWRDAMAGSWLGSGTSARDFPEAGIAKGDRFIYPAVWKPDADGMFMMGEGTHRIEGKQPVYRMRAISLWDPQAGQVRLVVCFSPGVVEDITIHGKQGRTFFGAYSIKSAGMAVERADIRYTFSGPDAMDIKFTDGPRKGQVLSSWKREAGSAERSGAGPSAAPLLKEYGALMVGRWECKECIPWGSAPGAAKIPIRGTCSWTADGAALEWDYQVGDVKARSLTSWDPVSKRLKEFVAASTGDCFDLFITKEAGKWVSTTKIIAADGKQTEFRLETTFDKDGGKHVNKYPTHEEVFTRVK